MHANYSIYGGMPKKGPHPIQYGSVFFYKEFNTCEHSVTA